MKNPTKHKAEEASFFLSKMKQKFEDDIIFSYYLSAFLSATRNITFYMQKQYKKQNGFSEWYCQQQIKMSNDAELKFLNKARAEDVHKSPVKTGATREKEFSADAILVKEGEKVKERVEEDDKKSQQKISPKTIRRFFVNYEREDVVEFSEKQLKKLLQLVEECEKIFT